MRLFQWRWKAESLRGGSVASWNDGEPPRGSLAEKQMGAEVEGRWVEVLGQWQVAEAAWNEAMRMRVPPSEELSRLKYYATGPLRCQKACRSSNVGLLCYSTMEAMAWQDADQQVHVHGVDHLLEDPKPRVEVVCAACGRASTVYGRILLGPCDKCTGRAYWVEARR